MIFEDPTQNRWKKTLYVAFTVITLIWIVFLAFLIPEFLIDTKFLNPNLLTKEEIVNLSKKNIGMGSFIESGEINTKNEKQLEIEEFISKIKKLPIFIRKSFIHTASIRQRDSHDLNDLALHSKQLDLVFIDWLSLWPDCQINESIDWNIFEILNKNHVPVFPSFSSSKNEKLFFDAIKNKSQSKCLISWLKEKIKNRSVKWINIDIKNIEQSETDFYSDWLANLVKSFHEDGLYVSVNVPLNNLAFDYQSLGVIADIVIIKAFDENYQEWKPWPIAWKYWLEENIHKLSKIIPAKKTLVALWQYSYDWNITTESLPEPRDFEKTIQLAKNINASIKFDEKSWNYNFIYKASDESYHEVWFLDAISTWNQYLSVKQKNLYGISLWQIWNEDKSMWNFIPKKPVFSNDQLLCKNEHVWTKEIKWLSEYPLLKIKPISFAVLPEIKTGDQIENISSDFDPNTLNILPSFKKIDFDWSWKMFKIINLQEDGKRELSISWKTISFSKYEKLPEKLKISRLGENKSKTIVLTFNSGPNKKESKKILSILKKYKINATFFLDDKKIEENPDVILATYNDWHILWNYSLFSDIWESQHSNKLIESQKTLKYISNHWTFLVRIPNNINDYAFQNPDEMKILHNISNLGYIFVGADIDSRDFESSWNLAKDIISKLNKNSSNIISMDEIWKNNIQTAQTLDKFIPLALKQWYNFISLNDMLWVSKETIMPRISTFERFTILRSIFLKDLSTWIWNFVAIFFIVSTVISVSRILFISLFVIKSKNKHQKKFYSGDFYAPATILVPAYNEEKVIEKTVLWLLESDYPNFEILVIDDWSKDETAERVKKLTKKYKNVRLISKKNEGKSVALNLGFKEARYEYIITIDADTIVLPKTVHYIMQPFADSRVDAVCGNILVGNVKNILTAFQEVEYVTSQNFDRRAFDALNCISVVPGATGAWKKQKVLEIGWYSSDTLVEDADLTLTLLENWWNIVFAPLAKSVTEAPEKVQPLFKQRFRWSYWTFQCFWKHRKTFWKWPLWIIALPNMLLFWLIFPMFSPIWDLVLILAIFIGDPKTIFVGFISFLMMDIVTSWTAYALEKKSITHFWVILIQRFFYRQFMYFVTFKSIEAALRWGKHGWNKLERKWSVKISEADSR